MAESELTTIARPYARAVFTQALDADSGLDTWSHMLNLMAATIQEPRIKAGLNNPLFTTADQAQLMISVLAEELNEPGKNFIKLLAKYHRLSLLPDIAQMYALFKANHERTMDVEVMSAFELEAGENTLLIEALTQKLHREVNLSTRVDKSLLGGLVIHAEDTVIDNSVRGKLNRLAAVLN